MNKDDMLKTEEGMEKSEEAKSKEENTEKTSVDENQRIEELEDKLKRTQAEFMNFKRRTEKEKESISFLANEKIVLELLQVIDNFERGLDAIEDKESQIYKGMDLIYKQLIKLLTDHQVQKIDTEIPFDPNLHHAVLQGEGKSKDEIMEVFQKGYTMAGKVIRAAMVKVSK